MGSRSSRVLVRLLSGMALLAALHACGDSGTSMGPDPQADARLVLSAVVTGTPIAVVTAEVTAADIATPLLFNLSITNGVATGTLRLPPGAARTVTVRAFEESGSITHEGSVTVDIRAGQNPPVTITLRPRAGQLPITATLGEVSVVITPATLDLTVGTTAQLTATIVDANGDPVNGTVEWAVGNPAFASVSLSGLVTGLVEGQTEISASFDGVAGGATVTVHLATINGQYSGTAMSTVSGQGQQDGVPVTFGSSFILGCNTPCPASLDLTQTGAATAEGTIVVGQLSVPLSFAIATLGDGMVLTSPPVDVSFDSPQGIPTTCTVEASGGIALNPTSAGLAATGPLSLSCSGASAQLSFTFTASGAVTLDLVRPAT
jgi:Big-like domain-containing protein